MKKEILDLYDNDFNKLDQTIIRREDEIPEGKNIMSTYILIENDNKYLLEQTTSRNEFKWAIPGGHVLSGETDEIALRRELNEELGIENINYEHIEKIKFPYNKYIFSVFKSTDTIDKDKLILQPEEVTTIEWFTKEEISKMIEEEKIPRGYAYILNKYM